MKMSRLLGFLLNDFFDFGGALIVLVINTLLKTCL